MNSKLKFFSLILSSFFIVSCLHTQDGKVLFKKGHHHSKKSCWGKKTDEYDKKSKSKRCHKSKKWGNKKKFSKDKARMCDSCKDKNEKCDTCKYKKKWDSCQNRDQVVGLALVKGFENKIKGSISFERMGYRQVQVVAQVEGLKPNQKFGFHVHEFGNCENKGIMAGAHLNPGDSKHGGPKSEKSHLGDLGNLKSNKQGKAQLSLLLNGKLKIFMGRSVIIHESQDDLKTQPTGNSGKRVACGIIGAGLSPIEAETKEKEKPTKNKAERKTEAVKPKNKAAETKEKAVVKPKNKAERKTEAVKPKNKAAETKEKAVVKPKNKAERKTEAVKPKNKAAETKEKAVVKPKNKAERKTEAVNKNKAAETKEKAVVKPKNKAERKTEAVKKEN